MRHSRALVKADKRVQSARRQVARMRQKMKNNPNLKTIGSTAVGGALPCYLPNFGIPEEVAGIPTEGLIGAGLLYVAHMRAGKPEKEIIEGLGSGMIAVTAFKIAKKYNQ